MSKKTRKKSPKLPAGKAARAKSGTKPGKSAGRAAKTPSAKKTKAAAANARVSKQPGKASAQASHRASSKPLKPSGRTESVTQAAAARKTPAVKPAAAKAPAARTGAAASRPAGLSEGGKAPAFRLPRDGGDTVSLADFKGRKLVLFFYPRADTPGCTKEAIDFSRLSAAFAENQTAVMGVSADPPKAQEAFRDKHELVTPLASDEPHEMLEAYGVWGEKSMYGKTFLGIVRTTVLVGADAKIIRIWRNVRVDGHADEVLAVVRSL